MLIVSLEIVVLALATTVRPTSLAATYALLGSAAPRRLMTAYVVAGLVFTVGFGLIVALAVGGIDVSSGSSKARATAEIAGGIVALAVAVLVWRGRVGPGTVRAGAPHAPRRWDGLLEKHRTVRNAALAGPATHLPGIFYLLALNLVIADALSSWNVVFEVLLFNLIWFLLPLVALAVSIVSPELACEGIGAVNAWAARHTRAILLAGLGGVGVLLLVSGLAHR